MAIVIDNGTGIIKVGKADNQKPDKMFPTIVGRPDGSSDKGILIGDLCNESKERLKIGRTIENGLVQNWDDMERIWNYALDGKKNKVLLTEPWNNAQCNKGKAAEIFFEKFKVPAFYVQIQDILSLYASGRMTGVVLTVGEGVSSAVPIYEGFVLHSAAQRSDIGGRDVTDYLQMLLRKGGYHFHTSMESEVVKKIKEKRCYLSQNIENDEEEYPEFDGVKFTLPDNKVINVGPEKFRAPELLMTPSLIGKECMGLCDMLEMAISMADLDMRKTFWSSITLAGGSTKLSNFGDRLLADFTDMTPDQIKVKIYAPKNRHISAWVGGAILAGLGSFKDCWVTAKEYKESGKRAVFRKCSQ